MDAKNYFLKRYKDRIATEYAEAKEIQLASFDGWDMIDFAQSFHEKALKNIESLSRIIQQRELLEDFAKRINNGSDINYKNWLQKEIDDYLSSNSG